MSVPTEKNPRREMLMDDEYEAMLAAADTVADYMPMLVLLAGETGRRIGLISPRCFRCPRFDPAIDPVYARNQSLMKPEQRPTATMQSATAGALITPTVLAARTSKTAMIA